MSSPRLIRFIRLPSAERALLIEAAAELCRAGALVRTRPFARIAGRLGDHMAESDASANDDAMRLARQVHWAVETASRALPWRPVCLPQAIAATSMLRRRAVLSTMYLGVDPADDLDAHAWVRVGPIIVTGGPAIDRFTVVSTFA